MLTFRVFLLIALGLSAHIFIVCAMAQALLKATGRRVWWAFPLWMVGAIWLALWLFAGGALWVVAVARVLPNG